MPNITLDTDNVSTLPPPLTGKPAILYRDEATSRMLLLRVSPTGSRVWLIETKNGAGKEVQRRFGEYPALSLAEARREAYRLEAVIAAEGIEGKPVKTADTLLDVFNDWVASKHPKDTTKDTYRDVINGNAKEWWGRPFRAITREEVLSRCTAAWDRGANRQGDQLFQTIRALANHGNIVPNPGSGIKPKSKTSEKEASRPLSPEVLPALLDAIDNLNTEARAYYYVELFTGFRGLGAKAMEWRHLTLGSHPSYEIPSEAVGFKKGGSWKFPLPAVLGEALERYKKYHDRAKPGSLFLFPGEGNYADSHRRRGEGSLKSLRTLSGLPGLRDNDFRDTWASYIQALYQKNFITERLLDHRAGGKNINASEVGFLYATAIPASVDMSAQLQLAAVDQGEALRPLVAGYASAVLYLAKRGPAENTWTANEQRFYKAVTRVFLERNPQLSVEQWLHLAAAHPQIAFAPQEVLESFTRQQALGALAKPG